MNDSITCTRRLEFDAGHRVWKHGGKCRALHGHRYVVEVELEAPLDDMEMVLDFGLVKQALGAWIDHYWDHGLILDQDDPLLPVLQELEEEQKLYVMEGQPTAENMAAWLARIAPMQLPRGAPRVRSIRVWETPNCSATWRADRG